MRTKLPTTAIKIIKTIKIKCNINEIRNYITICFSVKYYVGTYYLSWAGMIIGNVEEIITKLITSSVNSLLQNQGLIG